MRKRVLGSLLCTAFIASMFLGCNGPKVFTEEWNSYSKKEASDRTDDEKYGIKKYPEFITVDVFDGLANY